MCRVGGTFFPKSTSVTWRESKNCSSSSRKKTGLSRYLNECLPNDPDERVQIMIGSELGAPCMEGLTVITSPHGRRDGTAGVLGIIGPTRMEYRTGISVVGYVADVLDRMISA